MNNLRRTDNTREIWINKVSLNKDLITGIKTCDILFLPIDSYKNIENGFLSDTYDLFQYLKNQKNISTDICINDEDFTLISLNSREFRFGKVLLKEIVLPIFIGFVSDYLLDYVKATNEDSVSLSITIEKENGNYQFDYEGNVENFLKLHEKLVPVGHNLKNKENENPNSNYQQSKII
ncbi:MULTISPECIES: hypothetical protein [Actinobacillus]|uniref:hypothetical protein n=1 Tax=Actinobacillus TaxID=713 RepID=UPI002441A930|nr:MULTISPECIES: hypothetical protein [Actinobacillus]WGE48312.1 hypothetical protein NYR67_08550 [Actinobacillus equuli subsp. equuli]WGE58946.1 hypothetical protein NYR73_09695 [Actinobacillus equuli subsp. haemolyticus]WGE60456.1 hypothetical protein NYR74_06985 [Actinobacillus equuli subsp. haemolyticus]WGE71597.1 hypothetical protein NYR79_01635 [Actinobacillus equuli subsp. haemolyticus]WGE89090.1 hypothetical protein NYR89_08630 [Actinobacillus arthritidis]